MIRPLRPSRVLPLALAAALVAVLLAVPARADDTAAVPSPTLRLADLDLLPLGEFERDDLREAHPELSKRLRGLAYRIQRLEQQLEQREKQDDEPSKKLRAEIDRLHTAAEAPLAELTEVMRAHGLTDAMLATMARAPTGPHRGERYAHHLVLLLEDLDPTQRALFERVVPEVDGAYLGMQALQDRTELALKQGGLEPRQVRGVLNGFRRQANVLESRFWRLVDYVLEDEQRTTLWTMLPTRMRVHASAQDHVFALPTLSPTQGARLQALVTEVEAESAPDQALVNRLRAELREKGLGKEERAALQQQQREAYARLRALKRYAHETTKEILTPEQVRALMAIPPRVSANDRRRQGRQVMQGMVLDADQEEAIARLREEGREVAKAYRARVQALRTESGEVGPDSPQQAMMEMMMTSARGEVTLAQRRLLGRVFREVLTPDQVSGWVMGLYGDRR